MERFDIDYSKKNLPLSTERMRQKSLELFNKLSSSKIETYGFPSSKCKSTIDELESAFESDLLMMIKNIEFRKITDVFQSKLHTDIKIVKQSKNIFISADKSTNICAMEKDDYNQYLRENITKTFKKQTEEKLSQSIMKQTKLWKNHQLMIESRK